MEFLKNPNFDFLGKTRYFVGASVLVVLAGLAYMLSHNLYLGRNPGGYGVEFSGGTQLIVKFQNAPDADRIRTAVESVAPGAVVQTYDDPAKNQMLIRLAGAEDETAAPTPETAPGTLTPARRSSHRRSASCGSRRAASGCVASSQASWCAGSRQPPATRSASR